MQICESCPVAIWSLFTQPLLLDYSQVIEHLNTLIVEGSIKLRVPDPKFNRQIGDDAGKIYSVEGNLLLEGELRNT